MNKYDFVRQLSYIPLIITITTLIVNYTTKSVMVKSITEKIRNWMIGVSLLMIVGLIIATYSLT